MSAREASLELAHEALANDPTDRPSQLFASNTFRPLQASMDALTALAAGGKCLRSSSKHRKASSSVMSAYTPPGFFPAPVSGSSTPAAEESLEGLAITIINAFTSGIKPPVTSMLIAMALTGAMVPLLCAVFLFSSSTLRRKPVFALNVFAVFMAMAMGLTIVWFGVRPPNRHSHRADY